MLHKIYTVHDVKAGAYLPPYYAHTRGMAARSFEDACNDETHQFHKHPADYTLFEIGTFDDAICEIKMLKNAEPLGKALDFINPSQE